MGALRGEIRQGAYAMTDVELIERTISHLRHARDSANAAGLSASVQELHPLIAAWQTRLNKLKGNQNEPT